jgi:uncharacterized protein (DUF362 family)/Pyruvate/2-oxoacid:ferredoxin oxidoreductase delta subunit
MVSSTVSIQACEDYQLDNIRSALATCLAPLGGMQGFVKPGMKVLLKPNLLTAAEPGKAVTTHPGMIRAVAEAVRSAGGIVWVGDSPAAEINEGKSVWETEGLGESLSASGAKLIKFKGAYLRQVGGVDYYISRPVLDADLVINLPKMKTHTLTRYTGAVKNLLGVLPGGRKREIHVRAPGVTEFSRALVDILELVKPQLNIMDGILGMEGNGPGTSGTPHAYNLLAASADAVALDSVLAGAMGFSAGGVVHLAQAEARGLGNHHPERIHLAGDRAILQLGKLDLPKASWFLDMPSWFTAPIQQKIKLQPQIDPAKCTACGTCADACPAGVITVRNVAEFELSDCIGCMCCVEVCPHAALTPKPNLLARLVGV